MKESIYTNYDELPPFLNADTVAKALGIAISSAYELMQEKDFPTFKVGNRKLVEKENFRQWIEAQSGGAVEIQPLPKERCSEKLFSSAE